MQQPPQPLLPRQLAVHRVGNAVSNCLGRCATTLCPPPHRKDGSRHGCFGEGVPETLRTEEECIMLMDSMCLGEGESLSDVAAVQLAFASCSKVAKPRYGECRSACLALHRQKGCLYAEVGLPVAVAGLASGCCAAGSAFMKVLSRHRSGGLKTDKCDPLSMTPLELLVLVSDTTCCLTPGHYSREFIAMHADMATPVLCAWRGGASGRELRMQKHTLQTLLPHPNVYRQIPEDSLTSFAGTLREKCAPVPEYAKDAFQAAFNAAVQAARAGCKATVSYASALDLQGVGIRSCAGDRHFSLDGVIRLLACFEEDSDDLMRHGLLLVCDQWGVLHAPCATSRCQLFVRGLVHIKVLLHDAESGAVVESSSGALAGEAGGEVKSERALLPPTSG